MFCADKNSFLFSDLSSNQLSTFHKETFRGLTHLLELDLSYNLLDYLPVDLLKDLDGLTQMYKIEMFMIPL